MSSLKGILRVFLIFLLAFAIYIIYTGSLAGYDIVTGVLVSIVVSVVFSGMIIKNPLKPLNAIRWLYLITYAILYFTYYETKAHVDVIKRILHPKTPVNPAIIETYYNANSDYAITTIANSITNTPGTVVVEIDETKKAFYIHWIDAKTLDPLEAKREIFESFEKFARRIFD